MSSAKAIPHLQVDPSWPNRCRKAGSRANSGAYVSISNDTVVNRRDITVEEAETSEQAPPIVMFDLAENMLASWGDPNVVPRSIHGCAFDLENDIWVGRNDDGILQKYNHEGKLLMQIGARGVFDSSDGTSKGAPKNARQEGFFNPAEIAIDPANGDLYVTDGADESSALQQLRNEGLTASRPLLAERRFHHVRTV